jgi:hypothetical protein
MVSSIKAKGITRPINPDSNHVLKHGGHLTFSDMIMDEKHSEKSCGGGESWADCVAGTIKSNELIQMPEETGFNEIKLLSKNHYKMSASTIGATFSAKKV